MALDLSKLASYTREASPEHLTNSIMGADTINFLKSQGGVMVGVKGSEKISFLSGDIHFQDGSDCGRNPLGTTSFDLGQIEVAPIKHEENLCPKKLEKTWMVEYLSQGQTYTEMIFANDIMKLKSEKIAKANELALWKSSKLSTDPNLNKYDGFILQLPEAEVLPTESTLTKRLQRALKNVPAEIKNADDFYIIMSHENKEELDMERANANYFNDGDYVKLFGTSKKIQALGGLIDEDLFIFARARSFRVATDLLGEEDSASMEYSFESKQIYLDYHFALGTKLIFKDEVFVFKANATEEGGE